MADSSWELEHSACTDWPHPRPFLQRNEWMCLNGEWQFCKGRGASFERPEEVQWETTIKVPFSPETEASGIQDTGFYSAVWYRRTWQQQPLTESRRLLLHFEAVDWQTTVWVNGRQVCSHQGGYSPFMADITDALVPGEDQEIVVRAEDDYADLAKPRGKQDWKLEPHSIWYPRTTGIWQMVWLETVPGLRLEGLQWSSSLDRWEISLEASVIGCKGDLNALSGTYLSVKLAAGEQLIAHDTYRVVAREVHRRIALSDPGIDDFRNTLLWCPSSPTLIDATLELRSESGELLDSVHSYTALRSVSTQGNRFVLNNRPINLRLVLDQGYWVGSGLTAPSDEALVRDIELAKQMGFNGVRKHQKIESARYLYWADRLGLLVWEEMPSAYRYTTRSIQRLTREWLEIVQRDRSHPCIIAWVPFNESWGVPDLPDSPAQRHYIQALYHMTKALDPTRPVVGNDGWESVATDIIGIHDYDDNPERLGNRYRTNERDMLRLERPGGRMLTLGKEMAATEHPIVLTEFGGIAYAPSEEDTWGYSRSSTAHQLLERYRHLMAAVGNLPSLAGFCYTQFADTYQEANGLLYADRTPKAPLEQIAQATTGNSSDYDPMIDTVWRENLMQR